MNLWQTVAAVRKRKWVMVAGFGAGLALAGLSLWSVGVQSRGGGLPTLIFHRKSHTVYEAKVSLLIDIPGFGVGRADVPMDKPAVMAPTYAYLATSDQVLARVRDAVGEPIDDLVIKSEPVERSPVFFVAVQGRDRDLIQRVANADAKAIVEYVTMMQERNDVPEESRLSISILGSPALPEAITSRDVEIALVLFLAPVALAFGIALAMENVAENEARREHAPPLRGGEEDADDRRLEAL